MENPCRLLLRLALGMLYGIGNERGPDKDVPDRLDSGIFLLAGSAAD
jgi:hypothetical protein